MSLPASTRINYATNTSGETGTNWAAIAGTSGTAALATATAHPWVDGANQKVTWSVATTAVSGGISYSEPSGIAANSVYYHSIYVRSSKLQRLQLTVVNQNAALASVNVFTGAQTVVSANTWTRLSVTGTSGAAVTNVVLKVQAVGGTSASFWANGDILEADGVLIEQVGTLGTYFNGNTPSDPVNQHGYSWAGTPNASISREDYCGIYVEQVAGIGMPRVNVYATGLGNSAVTCKITRSVVGDTWTVPGWRARNVTVADVTQDWFVPLNVQVQYNLYVNGVAYNSMYITVTSNTGWVCDPLQPDQAMPMALTGDNPAALSMAKPSMKKFTYDAHATYEVPDGSQYPVARAGQRSAGDVAMKFFAHQNTTSDQFRQLVNDAPIILFKSLPTWGVPSTLMYLAAPVVEEPMDRDIGRQNTTWSVEGPLVQAVVMPPISGAPTYDAVATQLGTRTYANVTGASGYKRYVDIQAAPLGLGS
jgi:hypothetical protein